MLLKIGRAGAKETADDAGGQLLDCHERIRRFTEMAVRLASAGGAPEPDVKDAAMRVHRYFVESLPRHAEDEDRSIAPRLRQRAAGDREVIDALEAIDREHREHEALLISLVEMWAEIAKAPERLAAFAADLGPKTSALDAMLKSHLELEERVVIPAMRRWLTKEDDQAIREEMRARRPIA